MLISDHFQKNLKFSKKTLAKPPCCTKLRLSLNLMKRGQVQTILNRVPSLGGSILLEVLLEIHPPIKTDNCAFPPSEIFHDF